MVADLLERLMAEATLIRYHERDGQLERAVLCARRAHRFLADAELELLERIRVRDLPKQARDR